MADLTAAGVSGLNVQSGRVYEEPLRELQGGRWRRSLAEMTEQHPVIGGILFAVENLVRQVAWQITPAADDPAAAEVAEFVRGALFDDMDQTWPDTLAEVLSFLPWGWAYLEVVYKVRGGPAERDPQRRSRFSDGKVGWRTWGIRAQDTLDRWEFDDAGNVTAMVQRAGDYKERRIPRDKALHFRTTSRKGNPEGRSILRSAYRPWYFHKHIQNIEGIGVERDLAGLPVLWAPWDILTATEGVKLTIKNDLIKLVTNIKRDEQEGVLMPLAYDENGNPQYKLELLTTGGRRQFDTNAIANRYKAEIAMSVLADFIVLGHEKVGSFALASSKTDLFAVALGAWLHSVAAEVNNRAIAPLCRLNGVAEELVPALTPGDVESVDLGELGAFLESLNKTGLALWPNPTLQAHVFEQAGLPPPPTPEEFVQLKADVAEIEAKLLPAPEPEPPAVPPEEAPTDADQTD